LFWDTMSMLFEQPDPNERFRSRRAQVRRRRRRRNAAIAAVLLGALASMALGMQRITSGPTSGAQAGAKTTPAQATTPVAPAVQLVPWPDEIRGVHVTMALASIGKLDSYLALKQEGLNTIELDVKDENGEIGFVPSAVPLAIEVGAAKPYYKPREVADRAERDGVYLIGRVVTFEDPVLASARPELAIRRGDGSVWRNHAGLGWTNPYDRRVWEYNVAIAEVAARAGFDEIQFDYVRFPSDGPVDDMVFPVKRATPPAWVIAEFLHFASKRLKPLGVRVTADVFGLAATRDLGIGQLPKRIGKYVDALYPMTYPSHYSKGEYGIDDPNAAPGETVLNSLSHFRRELRGTKAELVPWIQDFSLGRTYTLAEVQAQIDAARLSDARGYLLWNPLGIYTQGALRPSTAIVG
jgi:hypothetical protein